MEKTNVQLGENTSIKQEALENENREILLANRDKIHTTPMGVERIKRNLGLHQEDVVSWCRQRIASADCQIRRKGKNWYAETSDCVITVNAYSFTIITAHRVKQQGFKGSQVKRSHAKRSNVIMKIRNEEEKDYKIVEEITRKAFYNMYVPGGVEHYLVHIMRGHEGFIPELDFVAELDGQIIGNIMYTKAKLVDEAGTEKEVLTFGPVSIDPVYQRRGYGKMLMEHSFEKAVALGYDVIVIFGSPANYVSRGFKCCKKYTVCLENGKYPAAMMVKELIPGALDGRKWFYYESPVMAVSEEAAQKYDDTLEKMEKLHRPSQEEFYIMSQSFIE